MKKRIFTILLTSIILLAMIAPTAWAANPTSGKCGDNLYWSVDLDTRTLTISGTGPMYDYKESFAYEERYTATPPWSHVTIGADVLIKYQAIIIEPGVTSIGNLAFRQVQFSSITIPDSVTKIGDYAFWGCKDLTSVVIPDSVASIGYSAFESSGLTHVTIPFGIKRIDYQFRNCDNLTSINIPVSVSSIASGAFSFTPLQDVYYAGSEGQWEAIQIEAPNDVLDNATIHYNSSPSESDHVTGFTDVPANAYYADAVKWAVENKITQGTSATTFSPDKVCTRGEIVTFLWRANGSPEPKSTANPFTDVKSSDYYFKAVLWAVENNITSGTGNGTFSPNASCNRAQAVTFQYRAAGTPAVSGGSSFSDVPTGAFYADAVKWAVEKGITQGTSATTFSPDADCSRAQIVTFLYRDMAE